MQIIPHFCRHSCIVVLGLCIAACSASPSPTSSVSPITQPTARQSLPPLTTIAPMQTPVSRIQQSVTIADTTWTLDQPKGIKPIVAAGSGGILWVQFPSMETNANIEKYAMFPLPHGDYTILYTPLRAGGGVLAQNAKRLLIIPSTNGQNNVSVISAITAGSNHFLLSSYELPRNAQNGGTTRIRWIEPDTNMIKEVVTAIEGGGTFLTRTSNQAWFFWNTYRVGQTSAYDSTAQAGLVNLQNGQKVSIRLDGPNVAVSATWTYDGMLTYISGDGQKAMILDPVTKQIRPQS